MIQHLRAALLTLCFAIPAQAAEVTVFAAASLGDALDDAAMQWENETGHQVTIALAGSSTLARQIEAGAPADLYLSANEDWVSWLEDRGRLLADSRRNIASNRLVLVAYDPALGSDTEISEHTDIPALLGAEGRLAIALPDAVPAGIYAKDALSRLGLWDALDQRLAPTDNVRAALALVALGEAPLGVVYATDAEAEPRVHVAGVFPSDSHAPILYPGAVVADSAAPDVAMAFLDWLESDDAQAILQRHGFLPPEPVE
ncbi:molybdate ABC transporter substrate-binding protein [uncultured Marivita sp.]|uniref:molybdate ABC transporter substrate-binding protein n=1 Tax=uncultured Marivita sp. TaxID=888080 RepID=UPI0026164D9A|nr:molybdate ABC transporter substrate-binding protein [uncultured Marivita sp.]